MSDKHIETYWQDFCYTWNKYIATGIFSYFLFLCVFILPLLKGISNLGIIIATIAFTVCFGFVFALIVGFLWFVSMCLKSPLFNLKHILILYSIALTVFLVFSYFQKYQSEHIPNDTYCYTQDYEMYHLFESCLFIDEIKELDYFFYDEIDNKQICEVCKWHYETPQSLNKKERRPND